MNIYFSVLSDIFSSKDFSNETTEYHLRGARMSGPETLTDVIMTFTSFFSGM